MWSAVAPDDVKSAAPSARSKHSATVVGDHVYLLGGRNGNLPTKDFWKYNLVTGKWHQLKPVGERLPCLQEHTAVAHKENIFVFGGEVSFSADTETPLWVYDIKANSWKKVRTKKGVSTPKGRRGHTALVYKGSMLIYGGYQDLKGSSSELWAFHFETESWHLLSTGMKNSDQFPPPRHKHSAVLHEDAIWIYGGMTDLQERSDLWKWDTKNRTWTNIKGKINPGPLHSHAACKMPSSMLIFGGERGGQTVNDLWKFNFSTESWEKITISGLKPQPRAETIAFTVSELLLNDPSQVTLESKALKIRQRTSNSQDRNRHSSYMPNNRVAPKEKTYVFQANNQNYSDGSDIKNELTDHYSEPNNRSSRSFLHEISKLSQLNISKISNKCSYTVLTGSNTSDSTESLLRQHASPITHDKELNLELEEFSTPSRGTMVKSKSAHVIKKKYLADISPDNDKEVSSKKRVDFDPTIKKITREPISVPNFSILNLATPVLTPVEATKLVYLTDEENDCDSEDRKQEKIVEEEHGHEIIEVEPLDHSLIIYEKDNVYEENFEMDNNYDTFNKLKRGESYSSHLAYADNPLYQEMIKMTENEENISSTSDYASIETVNRLSSASNYSVKTATPQEENLKNRQKDKSGPFGFCNPNYMGPDIKSILSTETSKTNKKLLTTKSLDCHETIEDDDILELQNTNGIIDKNTKVVFRHSCRLTRPPKTLELNNKTTRNLYDKRAQSASRVEKKLERSFTCNIEPFVPLYVYIMGGKEQGQVTVFQRPISIWKLKLF